MTIEGRVIQGGRKPKIPAVRHSSDTCVVNTGQVYQDGVIVAQGTPHHVHTGEWVEVIPVVSVKETRYLLSLQKVAEEGDLPRMDATLAGLCMVLSQRVIAWNWTDIMGDPLPQPYRNPEVLAELSTEEIVWLVTIAANKETAAERKNGSGASPSISSATALNQERQS